MMDTLKAKAFNKLYYNNLTLKSVSENRYNQFFWINGFTLLEVLISLAIISITFITLLNTHARNIQMEILSNDITIATIIAKEKIERILAEKESGEIEIEKDIDEEYPDFTWDIKSSDTIVPLIKEIKVTVYKAPEYGKREELIEVSTFIQK